MMSMLITLVASHSGAAIVEDNRTIVKVSIALLGVKSVGKRPVYPFALRISFAS